MCNLSVSPYSKEDRKKSFITNTEEACAINNVSQTDCDYPSFTLEEGYISCTAKKILGTGFGQDHLTCITEFEKPYVFDSIETISQKTETTDCFNLKEARDVDGNFIAPATDEAAEKICTAECETRPTLRGKPYLDAETGTVVKPIRCFMNYQITCGDVVSGIKEPSKFTASQLQTQLDLSKKLNKLTDNTGILLSPAKLIGRVIKAAMSVIGTIALLMFIYGGLLWMTARGNTNLVERATRLITWAALGVIVILTSYVIVNFVFQAFQ